MIVVLRNNLSHFVEVAVIILLNGSLLLSEARDIKFNVKDRFIELTRGRHSMVIFKGLFLKLDGNCFAIPNPQFSLVIELCDDSFIICQFTDYPRAF